MSFLFPLGFLGLLAIPVLVLIYIIKNKYTEQVIASTYLWTLSERFLKRRNPINKITGIISLILQILAVIAISFAIAHPVFTLRAAADDYCFIVDGSGSMNMENNEVSRLESAKREIRRYISSSADGSAYTLVYTGDYPAVVFEDLQDKDTALRLLNDVTPCYTATDSTSALSVVQSFFEQKPNLQTYLFTDKDYEIHDNVTVVNLASREDNCSLTDVNYTFKNNGVEVAGTASYFGDGELKTVTLEVYCDDETTPAAQPLSLDLPVFVGQNFSVQIARTEFASLRVRLAERDALPHDNEVVLYRQNSDSAFRTLLVSERPYFMRSALSSMGIACTTLRPEEYTQSETGGYGLYIFDQYSPVVLPRDGAVWFIDPQGNIEKTGFSVQNRETLPAAGKIAYSTSSSSRVKALLKDTVNDTMYVKSYAKCSFYRSFTTLLSYDGNPLLFVGANEYGNREVVFAFGLSEGDVSVSVNYIPLVRNLISYTFPAVVDQTNYTCGDVAVVNVLKNATSIRVVTPSGKIEYLDCSATSADYTLTEVGTYTITQVAGGSEQPSAKIFVEMPVAERMPTADPMPMFMLVGEPSAARRDGQYADIFYLFIFLAVIVIADWMVYCYEQYQLR